MCKSKMETEWKTKRITGEVHLLRVQPGGFDKEGNAKTLTFRANKELRKQAFLRLYVKEKGVSSYQEVQANEIPEKAKMKLEPLGK